nr:MAG TPA: hypothetical protein [Caudoviricetes sp.]
MERIKVTSQKQLDEIPSDFDGVISICFGTPDDRAIVKTYYENANIVSCGDSCVVVFDYNHVIAKDSSTVIAMDNVTVSARHSSHVEAHDNSSIRASDYSTIVSRNSSSVEVHGHSVVDARDRSEINICNRDGFAIARDNSEVFALPGSNVTVLGNASVTFID